MYIGTIRFGDFPIPARGGTAVAGLGWIGQPAAIACSPLPGEVSDSLKDPGILAKHVRVDDKGVLVADFAVGGRSVKQAAKTALASVLDRLENDPRIKTIKILGYDDCLTATPQDHRYLRKMRALAVRALLGPKAKAKVTSADGAPPGAFLHHNIGRQARARNRAVRIEVEIVPAPLPSIQGTGCTEKLMRLALDYLKAEWLMDERIKPRLAWAIRNSLDGGNDSFIRPSGGTAGIEWAGIRQNFARLCGKMTSGTDPLDTAVLKQLLIDLDKQLKGASLLLWNARRLVTQSTSTDALSRFDRDFEKRYHALLRNKGRTAYAGY